MFYETEEHHDSIYDHEILARKEAGGSAATGPEFPRCCPPLFCALEFGHRPPKSFVI